MKHRTHPLPLCLSRLLHGKWPQHLRAHRLSPRLARGWVWGVALLALGVAGCANNHPAVKTNLLQLIEWQEDPAQHHFSASYRHGALYKDFRPALVVDAIALDWKQRTLYVDDLTKHFYLKPAEAKRRLHKELEAFRGQFEMLLFVYEGTHRASDLAKPNPRWRIFLRDDEGELHQPSTITRLRKSSDAYVYIQARFRGVDRWVRVYRVTFPKLSKGALNIPLGKKPIDLILSGVRGKLVLRWHDPTLFYQGGNLSQSKP